MDHFIIQIGLILALAALVGAIARLLRQSTIVAFIALGVVLGYFRETLHLPHELLDALSELGIILLLFMAGLEIEIESFLKRWKLLLINGLGQIGTTMAIGSLLGWFLLDLSQPVSIVFFGLCVTLSSTILVLGVLRDRKELGSLHGQLILGLMVLQDIAAVLGLATVRAFQEGGPLGPTIAMLSLKLLAALAITVLLAKTVLRPIFDFMAQSPELIFLGSMGLAVGAAALSEAVHFSPEIAAFLMGGAIASLPYRLEIEDKVESLKVLGVILFFVTLGYGLDLGPEVVELWPDIVAIMAFVVVGAPLIQVILGWCARLQSRPAFFMGAIINQISEFSLILAALCLEAAVFSEQTFTIVTLATVGCIFLSCLGHQNIEKIYGFVRGPLAFVDAHSVRRMFFDPEEFDFEDHVVLVEWNELAEQMVDHFEDRDVNVLLLDIDPRVCSKIREKRPTVYPMYADIFDPETWDHAHLERARLIVSCMVEGQEAEKALAGWLQKRDVDGAFVANTDSTPDALELYEAGVSFVVQSDYLAALRFREILEADLETRGDFEEVAERHKKELAARRERYGDLAAFV